MSKGDETARWRRLLARVAKLEKDVEGLGARPPRHRYLGMDPAVATELKGRLSFRCHQCGCYDHEQLGAWQRVGATYDPISTVLYQVEGERICRSCVAAAILLGRKQP